MNVAIIGAGHVATVLGRLMVQRGHRVCQVINRSPEPARLLADSLGASFTDFSGAPDLSVDLFLIAVSDFALTESLPPFQLGNKLVLHTAGAVSKEVLKPLSSHYGVLYPLQSLRKEMEHIPEIPFLVDSNREDSIGWIMEFARSLTGLADYADDEKRLHLHTAAVVVSNFTNHLYDLAEQFCRKESVSFDLLKPLIQETAVRIQHVSPGAVQTGPAIRKDIQTLDKHLRVLTAHPKLRTMYLRITDSIMNP